jgi:GT2 family glycosyltransferase
MVDPLSARYRRARDTEPHFDGTFWLLTWGQRTGIALDEAVYRVWRAFDGRLTAAALPEATTEGGTDAPFVESTTKVLARAGVLSPEKPLAPITTVSPIPVDAGSPLPLVTVVILASRQARPHLETCLPSVAAQTYPQLEILLVDNQTTDDSVSFAADGYPQITIIPTGAPLGFAAANNLAIRQAQGDLLMLINEDTELASDCVAECVRVAVGAPQAAIVAPKMRLFHMRRFLNSMGTSVFPDGRACDNFVGYLDVGQFDGTREVFAACFGAAMLRRSAVEALGVLDERYHFYYEDLDWAYGARLRGYDVIAAPRAVAYHKFSATISGLGSTFKERMAARNRLLFVWKNLDFARARRLTRLYRLEDRLKTVRAKHAGRMDLVVAYRRSVLDWVRSWPSLASARMQRRSSRHSATADDDAFALTDGVPEPALYIHYPIISASNVRGHYMRLDRFRPETPWQPQEAAPAADQAPSLGSKVRSTLTHRGLRGLVGASRDYARWLVDSW